LKADLLGELSDSSSKTRYDFFLSYAHDDSSEADWLHSELLRMDPNLRVFIDKGGLKPGSAWQQEIYEAIDDSKRVLTLLSPSYLSSKVCIEEFNITICRHREATDSVLFPMLLYSVQLPTYMKLLQHIDCREFNQQKLSEAGRKLLKLRNDS
jgi:hypothetical protein